MELRPYQQEAKDAIFEQWDSGVLKTLLVLPTGCGKTVVFAKVTEDCVRQGSRVLILAHRGELLDQAADKLKKTTGLGCAVEKAESSCQGTWFRVVVGSVQTLMGLWAAAEGIIYDMFDDARHVRDVVARVYRSASSQIVFAAQDIFEKYMTKHKLSQTEAWNLLNRMQDKDSIQNLLMELKNKDSGENKQELIRELEAPAYRARIERLQLLLQQVDTVMQNVYQQEQQFDTSFFEQLAENAYYRTIYNTQCRTGLGFSFSHVDQKQIDRALRMNWSGKHYSNRIWKNTDDLAKTVKDELLVSLLIGRTDRETAAVITEKFGGGAIKARRLIRTESCFLSGELTAQAYEECDIQKYRYVATLDLRTSKICRELDGKTFLVSQRQAGKNHPPMHPWCRSTTISVIDDETLSKMTRAAYNPETGRTERVPANMTYKEWYEKYVKRSSTGSWYKSTYRRVRTDRKRH